MLTDAARGKTMFERGQLVFFDHAAFEDRFLFGIVASEANHQDEYEVTLLEPEQDDLINFTVDGCDMMLAEGEELVKALAACESCDIASMTKHITSHTSPDADHPQHEA